MILSNNKKMPYHTDNSKYGWIEKNVLILTNNRCKLFFNNIKYYSIYIYIGNTVVMYKLKMTMIFCSSKI